jgi:hypothetical protein
LRCPLFALAVLLLLPALAAAETLRVATWNISLDRRGPGLLVQDLTRPEDPQIAAAVRVLAALKADVILLTVFDHDHAGVALGLFADRLAAAGRPGSTRMATAGWVAPETRRAGGSTAGIAAWPSCPACPSTPARHAISRGFSGATFPAR